MRVLVRNSIQWFFRRLPTWKPIDIVLVWTWGLMVLGRSLRLRNPERFSDVVFSIMIHQRTELRAIVANKARVKEWVTEVVGAAHTIPTVAEIVDPNQLSDLKLQFPGRYVAKPSHASGRIYFLDRESDQFDPAFQRFVSKDLMLRYDRECREAVYRMQAPSILIEPNLVPAGTGEIDDFKIYCFHGVPMLIQHVQNRYSEHRQTFYSTDWQQIDVWALKDVDAAPSAAPTGLDEMLELAACLAQPFDFIRIDLYDTGNRILVGELTNTPYAARGDFGPVEFSRDLARLYKKTITATDFRQRWPGRQLDRSE